MTIVRLGDCGTWMSGGTPSKSRPEFWTGSIPWISAKSLHQFFVESSDLCVSEGAIGNGTRLVPEGTILFIVRGMSLKTEFRMGITTRPVAFNQDLKAISPREGILPRYLAYALKSATPQVLGMVDEAGHGTGRLQTDLMMDLPLRVPPLPEQRRIAEILGAFDDKIELNRKMNQTLEEMAQAIFKSWFIDFDGHTEFVDSELGRIPKGWRATSLGELCVETGGELRTGPFGTALNASEYTPRGTPVVAVRDIKQGYLELDERTPRIPPEVVERLEVYRLLEGDILFGRKGAVERSALVPRPQASWLMGSDCIRLRLPSELCPAVWAIGFRTKAHSAWMVQHATGSTMASLNQRILNGLPCVVPPKGTLKAAEALLSPLLSRENANRAESETLSQLRDTLLPKLISGEVRVRDAERALEKAV